MSLRYRNQSEVIDTDVQALLSQQADAHYQALNEPIATPAPERGYLGLVLISIGLLTFLAFMAFDMAQTLYQAWLISPTLAMVLTTLGSSFLLLLTWFSWRELAGYWHIRRLSESTINSAEPHRPHSDTALSQRLSLHQHSAAAQPYLKQYHAALEPHHQPDDRWTIYQQTVAKPLRQLATQIINQESMKLGGATALSAHSSIQLALIVWRSMSLLKRLAQLYGYRPGWAANMLLLKISLENMLLQVALDETSEALMGQSLVGKVSQQAASGLSAGLLIRRLGKAALDLLDSNTANGSKTNAAEPSTVT